MRPTHNGITMLDPNTVAIIRYRYRGRQIPTPWTTHRHHEADQPARTRGELDAVSHTSSSAGGPGKRTTRNGEPAPRPDLTPSSPPRTCSSPNFAWTQSGCAGLTLYKVTHGLQRLLATRTGACPRVPQLVGTRPL